MKESFSMTKDHVALVVIDMQRHFCDKSSSFFVPDSDRLAEKIKGLIDLFRRNNRPVIFTRHIDSDAPDNLMLRWWTEKISEKDPMSVIADVLDVGESPVVIKHQYDGFLNTQLEKILREKSVRQVVICGVLTNLCCETTARSAFMRGFEVYFLKDGTATFTNQMHEAALLNLSYGFATLMTIAEVREALAV
ncbi:MAG: isochorismatase family protein [candidate division WOR-3 bacterium]|nr:MAG: isochorismatase family protein [candidate division WOR-3 bacterium]